MINRNVIMENEIPYSQLEKLGITKEDVFMFPKQVLSPLLEGKVTPLVKVSLETDKGEKELPVKLQLVRDQEDNVGVLIYPIRKEILNDFHLNKEELKSLQEGQIVRKEINQDGDRIQKFFQLDQETNSLFHKNAMDIKLKEKMNDVENIYGITLGQNQRRNLLEGKPIELDLGNDKVTVGVNLKEPTGFQVFQGDLAGWQEKQKQAYDMAHPEFMGYVKTDQNRWEYQEFILHTHPKQEQTTSKSMKL